jgi:hypothetical protein
MDKVVINKKELSRKELLQMHFDMADSLNRIEKDLWRISTYCYGRKPKSQHSKEVFTNYKKAVVVFGRIRSNLEGCLYDDGFRFFGDTRVYYGGNGNSIPDEEKQEILNSLNGKD